MNDDGDAELIAVSCSGLGMLLVLPGCGYSLVRPRLVPARLHQGDRRADVHQQHAGLRRREADHRARHRPSSSAAANTRSSPTRTAVDALAHRRDFVHHLDARGVHRGAAGVPLRPDPHRHASSSSDVKANKVLWSNPCDAVPRGIRRRRTRDVADASAFFGQDAMRSNASRPSSPAPSSARSSRRSDVHVGDVTARQRALSTWPALARPQSSASRLRRATSIPST